MNKQLIDDAVHVLQAFEPKTEPQKEERSNEEPEIEQDQDLSAAAMRAGLALYEFFRPEREFWQEMEQEYRDSVDLAVSCIKDYYENEMARLNHGRRLQEMDERAVEIVREYIDKHLDKSDKAPTYVVYTVWKCKALQNWKYLMSSTLPDGMYYELTYNGDKQEWYLDAYKKFENCCIKE